MTETLQEFFDSRGVQVRVDREAGVIRGVKILGLQSRNGRTYLPEALARAVPLYETAKVNVNHPKGSPTGPRDYRDRIGVIRNVVVRRGEGLFADFHFNPKHVLAEQLLWDAEHAPENVGFSHNVQARTARRGDRVVVEAIARVQSVDLVADPATTAGLFESTPAEADSAHLDPKAKAILDALTVDDLKLHRADLVEALGRESAAELGKLREQVEQAHARHTAQQKQLLVRRLLREYQLPDPDDADPQARSILSDRFLESLLACESEQQIRELVEERAKLLRNLSTAQFLRGEADAKPRSRGQQLFGTRQALDAKSFVEAIT